MRQRGLSVDGGTAEDVGEDEHVEDAGDGGGAGRDVVLAECAGLHAVAEDLIEGLADAFAEGLGELGHGHAAKPEHLPEDQGDDVFLLQEVFEVAFAIRHNALLDRCFGGEVGADPVGHLLEDLADDAGVEPFLGAEVVVDHRLGGLGVFGDFAERGGGEALVREVPKGAREDTVAYFGFPAGLGCRGGTHGFAPGGCGLSARKAPLREYSEGTPMDNSCDVHRHR